MFTLCSGLFFTERTSGDETAEEYADGKGTAADALFLLPHPVHMTKSMSIANTYLYVLFI